MQNKFDPYEELMEIKRFCHSADKHIEQLHKNQSQIIIAINELSERLQKLEEKLNETSRPKR